MRRSPFVLLAFVATVTLQAGDLDGRPPVRFSFPEAGVRAVSASESRPTWELTFGVVGAGADGAIEPIGAVSLEAGRDGARYAYPALAVRYETIPGGLEQRITIASMPPGRDLAVEFAIDGGLAPRADGYFVEFVTPAGEVVLRYGALTVTDAKGIALPARLETIVGGNGSSKIHVVIDATQPVFPVQVRASLVSKALEREIEPAPVPAAGPIVGTPVTLGTGIVETVAKIMEREKDAPPVVGVRPRETHHELEREDEEEIEVEEDPSAPPPMSHWPPIPDAPVWLATGPNPPELPQTVGISFKAAGVSESGFIPPDSMGAVGPTQVLVHINGRVKTFLKTGAADGAINASDASFWASVAPGGISDPQVRFDRLSGRWFVLAITIAEATNNKIVVAVSSGPTIASSASFTFYSFAIGTASLSDASSFCDYPGFGVDANAIYTGCNMFTSAGIFRWTSAFVIRKSSVLSGGPIVVTGFVAIGTSTSAGPYAPRGVDNDDPAWPEGYIIGTDPGFGGRINIRRVTNPGGTPVLGANVTMAVSNSTMANQPASGSTTAVNTSDRRLFAAVIRKNKLTGVTSLWTSQSVETNATCVPVASGTDRRIGAKWYEIGNLTGFPSITQFGTLCTTGAGGAVTNSERGFLYPTVTPTGQGHMALAASFASSTSFVGVAAAGRLRTDPAAGTRAPETIVLNGGASYTINDNGARNRWGDYSNTGVDPNDDQTVWTFQEYADAPANNWSVRAVQLKAPPPAVPISATPVCVGLPLTTTTVTGLDNCAAPSCTSGLCTGGGACNEYFDPGPDPGGPGYANHFSATVGGGVAVNPYPATDIIIPASPNTQRVLQATLSLSTVGAIPGVWPISVTNPDGQTLGSGSGILTVQVPPAPPTASNDGPVCEGGDARLSASTVEGATYSWTGPGGFTSNVQNPMVTGVTTPGTYEVTVTVGACTSTAASTLVSVTADGGACDDANLCTFSDACTGGACVGTGITCTDDACGTRACNGSPSCTVTPAGDGTPCSDGDACTTGDVCGGGSCLPGSTVVCDDSNLCTDDSCNAATGCVYLNNTAPCNDGVDCTIGDVCGEGSCQPGLPPNCNDDNPCTAESCVEGSGCEFTWVPGNSCDDGSACTTGDTCTIEFACTGTPVPAPGDVTDVAMDAVETLVWPAVAGAARYDLVSSTIADLRITGSTGATCLANDVAIAQYFDVRPNPADGEAYYYLIRAQSDCGSGGYGVDSSGTPRVPAVDCP